MPRNAQYYGSDCTMHKYLACDLTFDIFADDPCVKSCLKPCERWVYHSQCVIDNTNDAYATLAELQLTVSNFDYQVFDEQYVWSLETFVGAIGGVLGFFLGFDLTVVFHMCLYVLKILNGAWMAIRKLRKKDEANMPDNDATSHHANHKTIVVIPL
jgi:hypothetical protein